MRSEGESEPGLRHDLLQGPVLLRLRDAVHHHAQHVQRQEQQGCPEQPLGCCWPRRLHATSECNGSLIPSRCEQNTSLPQLCHEPQASLT